MTPVSLEQQDSSILPNPPGMLHHARRHKNRTDQPLHGAELAPTYQDGHQRRQQTARLCMADGLMKHHPLLITAKALLQCKRNAGQVMSCIGNHVVTNVLQLAMTKKAIFDDVTQRLRLMS